MPLMTVVRQKFNFNTEFDISYDSVALVYSDEVIFARTNYWCVNVSAKDRFVTLDSLDFGH